MSGILSWANPLYKIVTGVKDLIQEEQARDRIYFNEVYRNHILEVLISKKDAGLEYNSLSKSEFMSEYYKTDICGEVALSVFTENSVLQQAVRNVCSHHSEEYNEISKLNDNKKFMDKIYQWYGEHLYKDYKERTWDGLPFHIWKAIRG